MAGFQRDCDGWTVGRRIESKERESGEWAVVRGTDGWAVGRGSGEWVVRRNNEFRVDCRKVVPRSGGWAVWRGRE